MKKLILGLLVFGAIPQMFAQDEILSEVEITSVNYKYLNAVDSEQDAASVKMLEEEVGLYDIKNSELYEDDYDDYSVSFYIPDGQILAAYDRNGKMTRTIEKFKDVRLPHVVLQSLYKRFPKWTIVKDVYRVSYVGKTGIANKRYKIKLKNGDQAVTVKTDEEGNFL